MISKTNAEEILKGFIRFIGLPNNNSRITDSVYGELVIDIISTISPRKRISVIQSENDFMALLTPISDGILNSSLVKQKTDELNERIKNLEAENKALTALAEDLGKYKHHFDLEMRLAHGDKNDI